MVWDPQAEYLAGLVGCVSTPESQAEFSSWVESQGFSASGDENVHTYGLYGSGAGKLTAHWTIVERLFPGCWPASRQTRGDCVSHSQRNACLYTIACEIAAGRPDEVTGEIEGKPQQPEEGVRDGVFASESYYWYRQHGGDGWQCERAARVAVEKTGAFPRKPYPELGFDLTKYSGSTAGKWGSSSPPENITAYGQKNLFRTAARCESFETVRDMLANGYGITSCGGEGFSSTRDENGVSRRSGSWAHAMAYSGCDDRDEIKAKYDGPLVLVLNSWGKSWISGPRRVLGTTLDIPEGSFWARWSDVSRRSAIAMSGFAGWPAQRLPNWTEGIF